MKKFFFKITSIFIILAMILSFAACGNSGSNKATSSGNTSKAGKKLVIGFAQVGAESGWRTAETKSIKEEAAKRGIDLKFSDAQQKQENQIKAIRSFIQQKVDVIGLAPVVDTGWETVFKEAKDAGIPIVLVDRNATGVDDLWSTFIGSDFVQEGKDACIQLTKAMGEKGNVVILEGTVGASAATLRGKGFTEELKNHPNVKLLKSQSGDFTRAKGKEVMESFLKSDAKNIQGVFAENDDMGVGAMQAIEEAGLKPGVDIKIVGVDGIKDAFQAMVDGKYNCSVECNPLLGPQFFDACEKLAKGEKVPKWIKSNEGVFPQDKAKEALPSRVY